MLYIMLTGMYPFEDPKRPADIISTMSRIRLGTMNPLPKHLSRPVHDLLLR